MTKLQNMYQTSELQVTEIDGYETPKIFSTLSNEVNAIRSSVAISDVSHIVTLRISGEHAHALLNRLLPRNLNLRNNKLFQSLFILDDKWRLADVYVAKEPESYLLLVKGLTVTELSDWFHENTESAETVKIDLLNDTHTLIALNGPFAWELLSELADPEIISLPYLSFYYPQGDQIIIRSGETGEYGYLMILPHEDAIQMWTQAIEVGSDYDLLPAGSDALAYCALENNFFNVHKEGAVGASPKELQLQWRVSYAKHSIIGEELRKIQDGSSTRRLTGIYAESAFEEQESIYFNDQVIGIVVNAASFLSGTGTIGLALIDSEYAASGISAEYRTQGGIIRTVSPPFVNNRSLQVNPQIHSYLEPEELQFHELSALQDI